MNLQIIRHQNSHKSWRKFSVFSQNTSLDTAQIARHTFYWSNKRDKLTIDMQGENTREQLRPYSYSEILSERRVTSKYSLENTFNC